MHENLHAKVTRSFMSANAHPLLRKRLSGYFAKMRLLHALLLALFLSTIGKLYLENILFNDNLS